MSPVHDKREVQNAVLFDKQNFIGQAQNAAQSDGPAQQDFGPMTDGKVELLRDSFDGQLAGCDPFGVTILRSVVRKTKFALKLHRQ